MPVSATGKAISETVHSFQYRLMPLITPRFVTLCEDTVGVCKSTDTSGMDAAWQACAMDRVEAACVMVSGRRGVTRYPVEGGKFVERK